MSTNWAKGQIEKVIIKKLTKYLDERGFLCETFRSYELPPDLKPVMSYASYTEPGITRGLHEHNVQTDIFAFIGPGNFMLKLWDNPAIVHGYKNISATERGMVLNYPDRLFMGPGRTEPVDEIRHEDDPSTPFQMD